jgi:hypothetical protein
MAVMMMKRDPAAVTTREGADDVSLRPDHRPPGRQSPPSKGALPDVRSPAENE